MAKASVTIEAPKLETAIFRIRGISPYVQNRFSNKAREQIKQSQIAGSASKKGKKREPKDFQACFEAALHRSKEGFLGIPAAAFRNAMISACKLVGFHMTKAKLALFVEGDGIDAEEKTPLVKILKGEPIYFEASVRNDDGSLDLRARPMWEPGWEADVRIRYDADLFTLNDIANLLLRAGLQVGIGEGRPDSKNSGGMGWGLFTIINTEGEGGK